MKEFYFTTAANHPGGSGYWVVWAMNATAAREKMFTFFGPRWAFEYASLDDIHPDDRHRHGIVY